MPRKVVVAAAAAIVFFVFMTAQYWVKQADYAFSPANITAPVAEKAAPDSLTISRLKIEAPIVYAAEENEKVFQEALRGGVVHYPGTADIGQPGNSYIFGHSSDYIWSRGKYKTVFALLPKIKIGDEITVTDRDGNVYNYKVAETKVVAPDDLSILAQPTDGRKLLTLQTSYPVGTALRRFVVVAELVEKQFF